jgi:hypothetical protein
MVELLEANIYQFVDESSTDDNSNVQLDLQLRNLDKKKRKQIANKNQTNMQNNNDKFDLSIVVDVLYRMCAFRS